MDLARRWCNLATQDEAEPELRRLLEEDPLSVLHGLAWHELVLSWLREGVLDGLRVDHPDGLRDPRAYFERLQVEAPFAWIVAEKVLEPGEELPADWPVAGTTGHGARRARSLPGERAVGPEPGGP
jgi:hypothetical protein